MDPPESASMKWPRAAMAALADVRMCCIRNGSSRAVESRDCVSQSVRLGRSMPARPTPAHLCHGHLERTAVGRHPQRGRRRHLGLGLMCLVVGGSGGVDDVDRRFTTRSGDASRQRPSTRVAGLAVGRLASVCQCMYVAGARGPMRGVAAVLDQYVDGVVARSMEQWSVECSEEVDRQVAHHASRGTSHHHLMSDGMCPPSHPNKKLPQPHRERSLVV